MNNFHQIPNMWSLEISRYGELRTRANSPFIDPVVLLEKYKGLIPKFLASTFIGPINLPIVLLSDDLDGYKLTYAVEKIERVGDDEFYIDGNLFKRIPGFSEYIISESGVVYSLIRHRFMYVSYNHAEYMTVSLKDDSGYRSPRKVHRLVYKTYIGELDPELVIDHKDDYRCSNHWSNLQQITTKENTRKAFLSRNNPRENVWTLQTIEKICELLEANIPTKEIARRIGVDYDSMRTTFNHLIHRIRSKKIYTDISEKYDIERYNPAINKRDSVLSENDVRDILRRLNDHERIIDIANRYKCTSSTISKIRDGRTWKHITRDDEGSTTIESST